jgi:ABC-type uncharacterized transport system permease subunit
MLAGILVLNTTFASSAPAGAIGPIKEKFELSEVVATLMISLFVMGYMFGPLLWGPVSLSEQQPSHALIGAAVVIRGLWPSGFPVPIRYLHLDSNGECVGTQYRCPAHTSVSGWILCGCSADQQRVRLSIVFGFDPRLICSS